MTTYQTLAVAPAPADGPGASDRPRRASASGTDPDEACLHYEQVWGGRGFRAQAVDEAFTYRCSSVDDGRVTLLTSTFGGRLHGEVPWPDRYAVGWFREGAGSVDHRRGGHRSRASDPFPLPTELPYELRLSPHVQHVVQVEPAFLEETARERHGGPAQLVVLDGSEAPAPEAVQGWRRALAAVTGPLVEVGTSPLLRAEAQLVLVHAILDLFPWSVSDVPATVRSVGPGRLRDAVDFVHEHAHEPITPSDVAAAAGLHPRTLQQSMSRQLGASPAAYVRQVRLDRVHAELLRAAPREVHVADVATRWGFGNLGRFSASYARRFGEQPRETLRR